jgi:hypothetical protein
VHDLADELHLVQLYSELGVLIAHEETLVIAAVLFVGDAGDSLLR